jgi:osmoprotectant transport system permease protein
MHAFLDALHWLLVGSHWTGYNGIPLRVLQHVEMSAAAILIAALIAVPAGMYVGHTRRFEFLSVSIANVGRAVPSFAILVIAFVVVLKVAQSFAFGFVPTVIALVLLAVPPLLTNTYVGIQAVDPDMVEAARGMGMTERDVLLRLEVPLAAPLIMAGLRTAALTVVATATLAALIGGGGLGRYIVDGFAQGNGRSMLIAGAMLVAVLAILTELAFGLLERTISPRTSSAEQGRGRSPRQLEPPS